MKRTLWILGSSALLFVCTVAIRVSPARALTSADDKPAEVQVKMINFTYSPDPLTVPVGTTVRWVNYDDDPHNVVAEDKSFKSKLLDKKQDYSYTFTKKGTFKYICSIHPKMVGKVVIE
jgi:plastocyanin